MADNDIIIRLSERVAVLETTQEDIKTTVNDIDSKLGELLELKSKGMGAVGLIGLIFGSGIIGLIVLFVNIFKGGGPHL